MMRAHGPESFRKANYAYLEPGCWPKELGLQWLQRAVAEVEEVERGYEEPSLTTSEKQTSEGTQ